MEDETGSKKISATTILVFAAACFAGAIAVRAAMANPDLGRTLNMRVARLVKRFAEAQVSSWQDVSDRASNFYQKQRI